MCWVVSGKWERSCSIVSFFLFTHSCSMFMMLAHLCHDPRSLWCFVASSTPRNGCRNVWRRGRQRNPQWEQMSKQRASWQLQCKVDDLCRPWGMDGFPVSVDEPVTGKYISKGQDGFLLCVG